jgi:putative SOS response-associated peptidase YedK
MCGRYTLVKPDLLTLRFDADADGNLQWEPSYNVAPSQAVPVIVAGPQRRRVQLMQWGFRPQWAAADPQRPAPINARAETLLERPLFRRSVAHGRCLIPADGFFEWQAIPGRRTKQPVYIRRRDGELFAFAGLYAAGGNGADAPLPTCAIITTAPNTLMEAIHNRMPAILAPEEEEVWLDPTPTDVTPVLACLRPYAPEQLEAYPVSSLVSSPRNNGPDLIAPLGVS